MVIELSQPLKLDPVQAAQLEMHSFLNALTVFSGDLELLHDTVPNRPLGNTLETCYEVGDAFRNCPGLATVSAPFQRLRRHFREEMSRIEPQPEATPQLDNLTSVFVVLNARFEELTRADQEADRWELFDGEKLSAELEAFLGIIEKNSLGRYHIVTNLACKEPKDYLVHIDINAHQGRYLWMPICLRAVMRDLVANARKYTDPGGTIELGLAENETCLRLTVKDNGRGIPSDQLARVVEFGYRARNVKAEETRGGGFGLTKAYTICRRFHGRMWLDSSEGEGTTVTIEIPRQAKGVDQ